MAHPHSLNCGLNLGITNTLNTIMLSYLCVEFHLFDWEGEYAMIINEPYLKLKGKVSKFLSLFHNHNYKRP